MECTFSPKIIKRVPRFVNQIRRHQTVEMKGAERVC